MTDDISEYYRSSLSIFNLFIKEIMKALREQSHTEHKR